MHSLAPSALPTTTFSPSTPTIPQVARAASDLAFSITAGSTAATFDISGRFNLMPASISSPKNTNTISLQQQVAVVPKPSWLERTIDRLLAQVPDDEWDKLPPLYVADLDQRM
jgi:hypothetical protein